MGQRSRIAAGLTIVLFAAVAPRAAAHQEAIVALGVTFGNDATFRLDVILDAEHLPPAPAAGSGLEARVKGMTPALETRFGPFVRTFLERASLSFDGRRVRPESAALVAEGDADSAPTLRLAGAVPTGSKEFTFSSGFDAGTFVLRLAAPGADEPVRQWLKGSETSRPFPLGSRVVPESRAAGGRPWSSRSASSTGWASPEPSGRPDFHVRRSRPPSSRSMPASKAASSR